MVLISWKDGGTSSYGSDDEAKQYASDVDGNDDENVDEMDQEKMKMIRWHTQRRRQ